MQKLKRLQKKLWYSELMSEAKRIMLELLITEELSIRRNHLSLVNTETGFATFKEWIQDLKEKHEKDKVVPGMEPTGHYWFNLGKFLQDNEMKPVLVNPHHVKKSKELDDNNPTKNDRKDPKVIAGLVREGRYVLPYLPDGVYADLRTASNIRFQLQAELTRIQNRISRWFNIYFPEYKTVYGKPDAKSGMLILKKAPLPEDIMALGIDGVN